MPQASRRGEHHRPVSEFWPYSTTSAQIVTYYFRTEALSASSGNATLSIRYLLDDGLVLYLNGAELYRQRMPAGAVSYSTLANGSIGDVTYEGPFLIQATNIAIGTNLFAAEVHQVTASSADAGFALEVRATLAGEKIPAEPPIPPTLRLLKWGGQYVLTWDDAAAALESSDYVQGPWSAINQSNPAFVSATNAATFYRLKR
jgi:hypothetical protein